MKSISKCCDDAFSIGLGLSMLDLLGRSAVSGRRAPLQIQEIKRIGEDSSVVFPMPKSVLFGERGDQLLRELSFGA